MTTDINSTAPACDGSLRSHMVDLHQHLLDMLGAKDHVDAGRIIGELHAAALNEHSGQLQPPGAAAGLNEPFGDSEHLAPGAGSGGDALDTRSAYALATSWRRQAASQKSGRNTLIRCAEELEATLAARQPVGVEPFGWWVEDANGVGYFRRTIHPTYLAEYQYTPGYSATQLYTAPPAPAAVPVDGLRERFAATLMSELDLEVSDPEDHRYDDGRNEALRIADKLIALATHPQPTAADELRTATEQRNLLAEAIAKAAVKSGIYREQPMTGPQLLMACDNMAECIKSAAAGGDA